MAPRKPVKKLAAKKPLPKVVAKAMAKLPAKLPAKPATKPAAAQTTPMAHNAATCPCPCHPPIDARKYGCWCNCHVLALFCQKGTLATWLLAAAMFVAFNMFWHGVIMMPSYLATATLWLPEEQMNPGYFLLADVSMALVFAILFRLAYTGCGGLVEGAKLGALIMLPVALSLLNVLGSQTTPVEVVQMWALGNILLGAITGALAGWLLKPCSGSACCK